MGRGAQVGQLPESVVAPIQRPTSPALAPALRTISGETPHYRARFEIAAADGADAAEAVKGIVVGWLHAKGLDVPEGAADIAVPAGWRGDFMPSLTDRARCLPIVLMTTDDDGKTPVCDATELASKLVGMATVYVIDMRDGSLVQAFRDLLPDRTPAGRYRIGRSAVMVYRPGIDLSTEESLSACTLFTRHRIERYAAGGRDGFINVLMQGLGRGIDARPGDVAGIGDVLWLRSRAESERQGERIERLRSRAKAAADPVADIDGLRAEIARLRSDAEAWEEIATDQERSYSDATAKVDELTRTVQRLEGEKRALERKAAQCAAPSEDDGAARVAECLQAIPRDLTDLLKLARSIWPNRIVVLPEAMDSAKSYDGNLAEEWDIVRGAATALYGLLFEDDGCEGQVTDEFQCRTGYELTFSESSATRRGST